MNNRIAVTISLCLSVILASGQEPQKRKTDEMPSLRQIVESIQTARATYSTALNDTKAKIGSPTGDPIKEDFQSYIQGELGWLSGSTVQRTLLSDPAIVRRPMAKAPNGVKVLRDLQKTFEDTAAQQMDDFGLADCPPQLADAVRALFRKAATSDSPMNDQNPLFLDLVVVRSMRKHSKLGKLYAFIFKGLPKYATLEGVLSDLNNTTKTAPHLIPFSPSTTAELNQTLLGTERSVPCRLFMNLDMTVKRPAEAEFLIDFTIDGRTVTCSTRNYKETHVLVVDGIPKPTQVGGEVPAKMVVRLERVDESVSDNDFRPRSPDNGFNGANGIIVLLPNAK